MNHVTFDGIHSFDDLHCYLQSKEIGTPVIKTEYIDRKGADGSIDMTDYFGHVKFGNRQLKLNFQTIVPPEQFMALFSEIQSRLHGRKVKIILSDDPDYYYVGRLDISSFRTNRAIGSFSIVAECEPYKLKTAPTTATFLIDNTTPVALTNGRKPAVMTITTDKAITVKRGTQSSAISAGTWIMTAFPLTEGVNEFTITAVGGADVQVTYQEGAI